MRIVLSGAGTIGMHIARELIEEKRDVVLIEKDPDLARVAANELDCMVVNDDACRPEALVDAGVDSAEWFLALTSTDEVNIVSCGLVSASHPRVRTVARVENPFYSSLTAVQRRAFGLDTLVNPAAEAAASVARIVDQGFAEDVAPLHDGRLQLRYVSAGVRPDLAGRTLMDIKASVAGEWLVGAVVRGGSLAIPDGSFLVEEGDWLYVLGSPECLDRVLGAVAGVRKPARRVLIIGATSITERLVERLMDRRASGISLKGLKDALKGGQRRRITVLDHSRDAGKRLARAFDGVDIIHGDSVEAGVLEAAGSGKADLVVCATESQTFNIMTAQLVKSMGTGKAVAVTLDDRFNAVAARLDLDAMVSTKNSFAAAVLALGRKAHIRTVYDFYEDDVEIVEISMEAGSTADGKRLQELSLPKGALVAFVIKGGEAVVPSGATRLEGGDTVAFIARKNAIAGLERVFGGTV